VSDEGWRVIDDEWIAEEPATGRGWVWHGTPGHFIGAYSCCFRLHTTVGRYRVSSVGCYHPYDDRSGEPHEIGSQRLYETMVFENDGPGGEPESWSELDSDAYNDEAAAEAGHLAMCRKWATRLSNT
jgi:hypothetical protein